MSDRAVIKRMRSSAIFFSPRMRVASASVCVLVRKSGGKDGEELSKLRGGLGLVEWGRWEGFTSQRERTRCSLHHQSRDACFGDERGPLGVGPPNMQTVGAGHVKQWRSLIFRCVDFFLEFIKKNLCTFES